MRISIKSMLHSYAAGLTKSWAHDRLSTVGASEVGQCLRKTWFAKNEAPADPDYVDRFGAKLRGTIIEDHFWTPGLRASLPEGTILLYAGEEQRTLVDGYLSATPDGLLVTTAERPIQGGGHAHDEECVYLECKSIDPRVDLKVEKAEHSFQTQAGMGLVRHATPYKPEYALISYIDASFLDDITEFTVPFDPAIYAAAQARSRSIMTATDALELSPEGKLSGGAECKYCPWASHCTAVTVAGMPQVETKPLGENATGELKHLRDVERDLAQRKDATETEHATAREAVKSFLRENGIRRYTGDDWAVSWSSVKGRETVDTKAAEAAGVDLSAYKKVGDPADRLTVK